MATTSTKRKLLSPVTIPGDADNVRIEVDSHAVQLTNLRKPFWPELGISKGDLIRYYADVSPVLLPHLQNRAMVMKRYPHGWNGKFFFMKRAPTPRPDWIQICSIEHSSGGVIDFPVIQGLADLLWVINLGCIDLNPWYARCDNIDRPDYVHFDLDPVEGDPRNPGGPGSPGVPWERVCEVAMIVRDALSALGMESYPKTTGSRGIHVYVPIVREPTQKQVWTFAKSLAKALASQHEEIITAEYRIAKRPPGRVLVDYNQNAWGRTLASVYSVRPKPLATVSAPMTWKEVERGIAIEDFRLDNMRQRIAKVGDLWAPVADPRKRVDLSKVMKIT